MAICPMSFAEPTLQVSNVDDAQESSRLRLQELELELLEAMDRRYDNMIKLLEMPHGFF